MLLDDARRKVARTINSILTATYWEIGRRIVEFQQGGGMRAEYGEELIRRLAVALSTHLGRGFSKRNLYYMRAFYLGWEIVQTPSAQFEARAKFQTAPGKSQTKKSQTRSAKSEQALAIVSAPIKQSISNTCHMYLQNMER